METLLLFPPDWSTQEPYFSLPCLTGALRAAGHRVQQWDLNIELFASMLRREPLMQLLAQRRDELRKLDARASLGFFEQRDYQRLIREVHVLPELVERIDEAVRGIRTRGSMADRVSYCKHLQVVRQALEIVRATLRPTTLDLESSADLLAHLLRLEHGPYLELLDTMVIPELVRQPPDVIGISLTATQQLLPGFLLARQIRRAGLPSHIVMGGEIISICREVFQTQPHWYDLVDSFVFFEGETPLVRLHEALERRASLAEVPSCAFREGGRVRVTEAAPLEDLDALPPPDFGGVAWDLYLSSERFLAVTGARGCSWGRCTFCTLGLGVHGVGQLRCRAPERVVQDMADARQAVGGDHFYLVGNGLPPAYLERLAELLIDASLDLVWGCEARMEPELKPGLLEKLARSGLRRVQYGLESAAPRVHGRLMRKGCSLSVAAPLLEATAAAGVAPHVFAIVGFPGETAAEADQTRAFLEKAAPHIFTLAVSPFSLNRYSEVHRRPEDFGVEAIEPPQADLARSYLYRVAPPAVQPHEARRLSRDLDQRFHAWTAFPETRLFDFHRGMIYSALLYAQDPGYLRTQADPERRLAHRRVVEPEPRRPDLATAGDGSLLAVPPGLQLVWLGFDLPGIMSSSRDDLERLLEGMASGRTRSQLHQEWAGEPRLPRAPTPILLDLRSGYQAYRVSGPVLDVYRCLGDGVLPVTEVCERCAGQERSPRVIHRRIEDLLAREMLLLLARDDGQRPAQPARERRPEAACPADSAPGRA